jgi:ABC-type glycerol-3-phosphate transport system substrate-binding protein
MAQSDLDPAATAGQRVELKQDRGPAPDEPLRLTVRLAADYAGARVFADINAAFERAHPGVKVRMLGVPWEDMATKVKTAVIGWRHQV